MKIRRTFPPGSAVYRNKIKITPNVAAPAPNLDHATAIVVDGDDDDEN